MAKSKSGKNFPLVTVILTSFNHAAYVTAAIDSVMNQTFDDFELLIVDDGSQDGSREIIKKYDDPCIGFYLYGKNRGPVIAIADALKAARGKYIAVHHSDDLWAVDKLEKQVKFLEANKNYVACFTWAEFIDEHGEIRELEDGDFYKGIFEQENRSRAEWLNYFFYNTNCLCHPSALVRREAYEKYHLTDVHGFWQLPDYLMWIRLCFHGEIFIMPERLTKFRLRRTRQENMSASTFDKTVRMNLEYFFVTQEYLKNFRSDRFFLEVFPEAQKFYVNEQINRRFALAKLCFERKSVASAAFQLTGLEILKDLLNSPVDSAQIKKLYDYDDKAFLRDSGNFDVFDLESKLNTLKTEIFISEGEEYTRAAQKIISVDANNKFYAVFDFETDKKIKNLRIDPDDKMLSVKLNRVYINGKSYNNFFSKYDDSVDGFLRFWTSDPQMVFSVEDLSGRIFLEIFGEVEENYSEIIERTLRKFLAANRNLGEQNENLTAQNENLHAQNENLSAQNENLHAQNENLSAQNKNLHDQNENLSLHNANLHAENQRLAQLTEAVLNSNSWKMTAPLRSFRQWLGYGVKDKALAAGRLLYRAMPLDEDTKTALKDKFYTHLAPILKDTERYKNWQMTKLSQNSPTHIDSDLADGKFFDREFFSQPGKTAIQAHIFYLDLLDEMAGYCANMPYKFDALISVVDESAQDKVQAAFKKISNAEKVIVRVVPNRGRDVAPFLVGFGDVLPEYEFIAHIHSKKSLYTGSEQQNWRNYLFDALLGSTERIRKIFKAFIDDSSVGVIYPRPADNVPYAAFTWLSNRAVGENLLSRAGIAPNKTDYFDFPAGTMFWARARALQKFFECGLTFEDFPPEQGQNDGTIAHAFERSILLAAKSEGMSYYEFEPETLAYLSDIGSKNLWQYYGRKNEEAEYFLLNSEATLSFDVFDTLIMRYVAKPYHVNEIIRFKVEDLLGRDLDFPTLRISAEAQARRLKGGDVTLDEIYKSFAELTELDAETCKKIRELEISTEVALCLPRREVVGWFKKAVKLGKKIWLLSDMYMQTPDLERLLKKCGITGYEKILLSCETGMRKDTAAIWEHFIGENLNSVEKLIHTGDNEMSDVQLPGDRKFGAYHVMSAINLFSQIPFGRNLLNSLDYKMSLCAGIFLGVILAKKFQDPFQLRNELTGGKGRFTLRNFRELGYWFYGAPLLTFMLWLIKKSREDGVRRILFLARDGYFLLPLYELVTKTLNVEALPADYFYASRRAVTVASIREIEQAKDLVKLRFEGTALKFFQVRFGMELGDDTEIFLPDDSVLFENHSEAVVEKIIDEHAKEILRHAATERANFDKYIATFGDLDNAGVVDMGYSGTIQYHLRELTDKIFTGYYFATSAKNRFGDEADERMRGCFTENDDYQWTDSAIYRYQLLFETILTAPDGQLKYFNAAGKPVFDEPEPGQKYFKEISEIHEGIKDFCRDVLEIFGDIILRVPIDNDFINSWVRGFVKDKKIVAPELREIFMLDDDYCNTFHGNAFEFYLEGLERPSDN